MIPFVSCLFIKVSVGERLNFNLGLSPYSLYLKNSVKCKTIWNFYTKCKRSKWDKIVDTLISDGYLGKFGESTVFYWRLPAAAIIYGFAQEMLVQCSLKREM